MGLSFTFSAETSDAPRTRGTDASRRELRVRIRFRLVDPRDRREQIRQRPGKFGVASIIKRVR